MLFLSTACFFSQILIIILQFLRLFFVIINLLQVTLAILFRFNKLTLQLLNLLLNFPKIFLNHNPSYSCFIQVFYNDIFLNFKHFTDSQLFPSHIIQSLANTLPQLILIVAFLFIQLLIKLHDLCLVIRVYLDGCKILR